MRFVQSVFLFTLIVSIYFYYIPMLENISKILLNGDPFTHMSKMKYLTKLLIINMIIISDYG